jgi:hypothetical protein
MFTVPRVVKGNGERLHRCQIRWAATALTYFAGYPFQNAFRVRRWARLHSSRDDES